MSVDSPPYAFVTLVTSDYYLPGALVVAAALRDLHPSPPRSPDEIDPSGFHVVCLVTPDTVNVQTLKLLRRCFDVVIGVEVIKEDNQEALKLLGRPDLETVLTKLHVFRLKSYNKIIYLDADVLPLLPLSHLFRTVSSFAAVSDVGWPDIFNSGVLVLTPGEDNFNQLMGIVASEGSWDGGDQGVLNEWRGNDWERLSFTYNTTPTAAYSYAPAYTRFGHEIRVIHFIGPNKPWSQLPYRAPGSPSQSSASTDEICDVESSYAYSALLDRWFAVFDKYYRSAAPVFSTTGELLPTAFKEPVYENAWDNARAAMVPGTAGGPLGLDKLKQLALEGLGQIPTREKGEGAYMTLPLDGRIDLMSRSRSQIRLLYSRQNLAPSRSNTDSSYSSDVTTPMDTISQSFSELSTSNQADTDDQTLEQSRWDPWSGTYTNTWDLIPAIQKVALHQFARRPSRRVHSPHERKTGETESEQGVYRSWEDRAESTSRDGDDEAEEEAEV